MWAGSACKLESPLGIAGGVYAWWDFSSASTLWTDDGTTQVSSDADAIYRCDDKSGNGYHLKQTTLAKRPLYRTTTYTVNGRSVARFDGIDDYMIVPSSTALFKFLHSTQSTVYIAAHPYETADPNAFVSLFTTSNGSTNNVGHWCGPDDRVSVSRNEMLNVWAGRGVNGTYAYWNASASGGCVPNTDMIMSYRSDAADGTAANRLNQRINVLTELTPNDSTSSASSANSSHDATLWGYSGGTASPQPGRVFEVLIFNTKHSEEDYNRVRNYLMAKWGVYA